MNIDALVCLGLNPRSGCDNLYTSASIVNIKTLLGVEKEEID